jgi:biopolymer transport protein ExbB
MIKSLEHLMVQSGALWVLWLMIALSIISVGITVDRAYYLLKRRGDVDLLTRKLRELLEKRDFKQASKMLQESASVEASVAAAGLSMWDKGTEAMKESMAAATGRERARLEERLGFLGTVGNNAPFVGLLGTVIGIVGAFDTMGKAGSTMGPELVMGNIAEALVATAVGLVVAIPVVALYNYFTGKITSILEGAETLGHVLLAYAEDPTPAFALLRPRDGAPRSANDVGAEAVDIDAALRAEGV